MNHVLRNLRGGFFMRIRLLLLLSVFYSAPEIALATVWECFDNNGKSSVRIAPVTKDGTKCLPLRQTNGTVTTSRGQTIVVQPDAAPRADADDRNEVTVSNGTGGKSIRPRQKARPEDWKNLSATSDMPTSQYNCNDPSLKITEAERCKGLNRIYNTTTPDQRAEWNQSAARRRDDAHRAQERQSMDEIKSTLRRLEFDQYQADARYNNARRGR
jgi:hypothetical protein